MRSVHFWTLALAIFATDFGAAEANAVPGDTFALELEVFIKIDSNKDNGLNEHEYLGSTSGKARVRARKEFRRHDDNGDGRLSYDEYSRSKAGAWQSR
jgi:hypothetical protein